MAASGFDLRYAGSLHLRSPTDHEIVVTFEASQFALDRSGANLGQQAALPRCDILRFDDRNGVIEMTPMLIYPDLSGRLRPKFPKLQTFVFEGYEVRLPQDSEEVFYALQVIPRAFYRRAEYGLGLPRVLLPLIQEVEKLPGIRRLLISTTQPSTFAGDTLTLPHNDFEDATAALERVSDRHQRRSLQERHAHARNHLISPLDPKAYPEVTPPYTEDTIFEVLNVVRDAKLKLSDHDRTALVSEVGKRLRDLSRDEPDSVFRLHREIELVNLDTLIARFQALMARTGKREKQWQKLFDLNPFVLSMVFGYPIVVVLREATVGGPQLDGRGAKIADFLVKNPSSSNAALVELKTPQQDLLAAKPYRGREGDHPVFAPHPELSGAVAQAQDQRYRLQKDIATHLSNTDGLVLKTYHVDCVVLAGQTPQDTAQKQAFEIYRHGLKDVRIVTFDELLTKLESLRELLASSPQPEPSFDGTEDDDFAIDEPPEADRSVRRWRRM